MKNGLRLLLATAVLGGGILLARELPGVARSLVFFQVDRLVLEEARYLGEAEVRATLDLPPGFSVWDDRGPLVARLRSHALVEEAEVRRRLPRTLVVRLRERTPVALLPTPALRPVDIEGQLLPLDPVAHRLDLPLIRPHAGERDGEPVPLTPVQRRMLATEVVRLGGLSPRLEGVISEAWLDAWGDVVVRLESPRTTLHFQAPLTPARLLEGMEALADALERRPDRAPDAIDLRFAEQVVVRYSPSRSR